jgi:lysozyme
MKRNMRQVNQATIDLIKKWEGFKAEAYLDTIADPPLWTIGYGTTERAGVGIVPRKGVTITEKQAERYLRKTVQKFADMIEPNIVPPINDNEFGAFVSLAYNIGPSAFLSSTALTRFNRGDKAGAVEALKWWNKAGGRFVRGLQNRRDDESKLFLTPVTSETEIGKADNPFVAFFRSLLKFITDLRKGEK